MAKASVPWIDDSSAIFLRWCRSNLRVEAEVEDMARTSQQLALSPFRLSQTSEPVRQYLRILRLVGRSSV